MFEDLLRKFVLAAKLNGNKIKKAWRKNGFKSYCIIGTNLSTPWLSLRSCHVEQYVFYDFVVNTIWVITNLVSSFYFLFMISSIGHMTKVVRAITSVHKIFIWFLKRHYPGNIYLFKVNNRTTRKRCEICSKLTIKTPGWRQWFNDVVLMSFLLTFL